MKTRATDRFRGGTSYIERWTNAKVAVIAFMTGRGHSSEAIAEHLADGTSSATIRSMWVSWGIGAGGGLVVPLTVRERSNLQARADQHGLRLEEYCRQMIVSGSMPRDQFNDIVKGGE